MADSDTVLRAYVRIHTACRARHVRDPGDGRLLTGRQASILSHLDAVDPTMVGELAEHVGVTASTMSVTLRRLEESGYVRRDRDPADRRAMNVRLTEAGVRMREASTMLDPERVSAMLGMLSPGDRLDAVRGLRLLADAADALLSRPGSAIRAEVGGEIR
jgi:DNA-binding MarR family transcriptional regulator